VEEDDAVDQAALVDSVFGIFGLLGPYS